MADTQKASSSKEEVFGVFRVGVHELNMGIAVGTFLKNKPWAINKMVWKRIFFHIMGMFWCRNISLLDGKNERFSWKLKMMVYKMGTKPVVIYWSYGAPANGLLNGVSTV